MKTERVKNINQSNKKIRGLMKNKPIISSCLFNKWEMKNKVK